MPVPTLTPKDLDILRRLGERKRAIAEDPVNAERRRAWYALDAGRDERVMVLAEIQGLRDPLRPLSDDQLACADPWARDIEYGLRADIYQFEVLQDDHVVEPFMDASWKVNSGNYGVEVVMHQGGDAEHMGSRTWDAPIQDLDRDFGKLRPRTFTVDRDATHRHVERLEAVFAGILPVRIRARYYWTMGMTIKAIDLVGLEGLMMAMYDNPDGLHRLMAFLRDDHLAFARWLQAEKLFSLNNENDYIGSGSMGYTRDLPRPARPAGAPVETRDLWVLLESQETVGVGPDLFETFVFPYQLRIAEEFGKVYYGCCEPVHSRWHILQRIPNLARVSISPWANQATMAEALARRCVFSRKPNPTLISTESFDESAIRDDLRCTLAAARGCRLEIIMKDVHTLNNAPERLPRWVQIAREEISRQP